MTTLRTSEHQTGSPSAFPSGFKPMHWIIDREKWKKAQLGIIAGNLMPICAFNLQIQKSAH